MQLTNDADGACGATKLDHVHPDRSLWSHNRGEYVQRVSVRGPADVFEATSPGDVVTLAGRLRVEEDGTYAVHFVPDSGSDRGWWRNLRENLEGLF